MTVLHNKFGRTKKDRFPVSRKPILIKKEDRASCPFLPDKTSEAGNSLTKFNQLI